MAEIAENKPHFVFESSGISPDELVLTTFSGYEGISQLMYFNLELVGRDADFDFSKLLNQNACITILCGTEQSPAEHKFHCIISSFEQTGRDVHFVSFNAQLVPRLWWLTLNHIDSSRCSVLLLSEVPWSLG